MIARGPPVSDYDVANGSLFFISGGFVMRARGARVQRLASLSGLGLSADPFLQPIGRLLALEDGHRLVVLHTDGTVFAWTPLPRSDGQPETISSSLVTAPRASAIVWPNGRSRRRPAVIRHRNRVPVAPGGAHRDAGAPRAGHVHAVGAWSRPRVAREVAALQRHRGAPPTVAAEEH